MIPSDDPAVATFKAGKFPLGRLLATPGAIAAMARTGQDPAVLLSRHRGGDWGDVCSEDGRANDLAIQSDERILSVYCLGDGTRVWIITEADRAATTILLPDEY